MERNAATCDLVKRRRRSGHFTHKTFAAKEKNTTFGKQAATTANPHQEKTSIPIESHT